MAEVCKNVCGDVLPVLEYADAGPAILQKDLISMYKRREIFIEIIVAHGVESPPGSLFYFAGAELRVFFADHAR